MKTVILLTAFNGERFLPAQLDSLTAQTDPDFTVLMQDDGSSDSTPQILEKYASSDPRFTFGGEQGRRFGAKGNFLSLIRQAQGDLFLFCDQDDIWKPDKVSALKSAMSAAEESAAPGTPVLVHSDCCVIGEDGSLLHGSFFRHQGWDPSAVSLQRLLVQNNVTGCAAAINRPLRDLAARYGKADRIFMHDWFLALTAASFGRVVFLDRPLTLYRQHAANSIGASASGQVTRGFRALAGLKKGKDRILLTYSNASSFLDMFGGALPGPSADIIKAYLSTRSLAKPRRLFRVFRGGYVMQSPVTRAGQLFFG